jgi:hypothetical protein
MTHAPVAAFDCAIGAFLMAHQWRKSVCAINKINATT